MKTCNDCIHCEACLSQVPRTFWDSETFCDGCKYFKDKSRFIELPCKVGDTVYRIITNYYSGRKRIQETEISRIAIDDCRMWLFCQCSPTARSVLGKNVFLTREEAEKALKGGKTDE